MKQEKIPTPLETTRQLLIGSRVNWFLKVWDSCYISLSSSGGSLSFNWLSNRPEVTSGRQPINNDPLDDQYLLTTSSTSISLPREVDREVVVIKILENHHSFPVVGGVPGKEPHVSKHWE